MTALDLGGESEHSESEVGQDRSAEASSNRKALKQRSVDDGHIAEYCSSRCKGLSFDLFRPIHEKRYDLEKNLSNAQEKFSSRSEESTRL